MYMTVSHMHEDTYMYEHTCSSIFRKRKFEEGIQRMLWKIKSDELNFKTDAESVRQKH